MSIHWFHEYIFSLPSFIINVCGIQNLGEMLFIWKRGIFVYTSSYIHDPLNNICFGRFWLIEWRLQTKLMKYMPVIEFPSSGYAEFDLHLINQFLFE